MKSFSYKMLVLGAAVSASAVASAEFLDPDGPAGFQIGTRMTLRPYVSLSYTFDSNVDSGRHSSRSSSWSVNPGLNFTYNGDNWHISGSVYYRYHAYSSGYSSQLNNSSYGEQLSFDYNGVQDGKGWSVMITESYRKTSQDDSMLEDNGRGLGRDRQQFTISGAINRRFNEKFHMGIHGSYYWLDYDNNVEEYAPLYGWGRWQAGAELAYTMGPWTDFFLRGTYSGYSQDNNTYLGGEHGLSKRHNYSGHSDSMTVHVGVRSCLTERISYNVAGGWSHFEYANSGYTSNGFTYNASLDWKISDTMQMMLLASSNYHPSEREYGASMRTDRISWGIAKSWVRGKLRSTFDVAYRHETHGYVDHDASDYNLDILTFRLGLSYTFNRFISVFGHAEYQTEFDDGDDQGVDYDYDRWRLTLGVRLAY